MKYNIRNIMMVTIFLSPLVNPASFSAAQGIIVNDPTNQTMQLKQWTDQLLKMKEQHDQLQQTYQQITSMKDSFLNQSGGMDVGKLAKLLKDPEFRQYLPKDFSNFEGILNDTINKKTDKRYEENTYKAPETMTADEYRNAFNEKRKQTARHQATADTIYETANKRQKALEELRDIIAKAKTPKEIMDLQTRMQAESALLANEQLKVEGIKMLQAAEERRGEEKELQMRNARYDKVIKLREKDIKERSQNGK